MAVKGTCQITLIDMTDAYSVILTSETYTFQGNSVGAPAGSTCSTEIVAYCGNDLCTKVSITAANIKCPTGISATVSNNNTVSPIVTFKTTAILTGSCEAVIPVVVDDITVNKKFSFAVAKTGVTAPGGNLVKNGYGEYLDNTNFNGGVFTKGDCPDGAYGYFTYGKTEKIPFDPTKVYDLEYYVRLHSGVTSGNAYFSIIPFDIDGYEISYRYVTNYNPNLFYLAKDLNKGDTVVYFADLSKWYTNTKYSYNRSFLFFGYKDSTGYTYPDGTYSRYYYQSVYADDSSVDLKSNTITLSKAWAYGSYKAGTCVAQSSDGSGYCYYGQQGVISNKDWVQKKAIVYAGEGNGQYDVCANSRRLQYAKDVSVFLYNSVADWSKISLRERAVKSIESTSITYQAGSSGTEKPTGTWTTSIPATDWSKPYLWTRMIFTYTDNTTSTSYSVGSSIDGIEVGGRNLLLSSTYDYYKNSKKHNNGFENTGTDTTAYFRIILQLYKDNSLVKDSVVNAAIKKTGRYVFPVLNVTNTAANKIVLKHNGIKNSIIVKNTLSEPLVKGQTYILSFNVTGYDPSVVGGLIIDDIKLEKGNVATDWTPAPEDGVSDVDVEYYLSTSSTSLAGGSWSTTAPAWVNGKYMWSRTVTTDGVGNKTYSPSQNGVCIAGAKGDTGAKGDKGDKGDTGGTGATGATGKGVSSIVEQYYKSTSATALSGGSWSTTYPGWENGKYIWTRSVFTYSDKTTTTTTPICATGQKGSTGAKGDTGATGLPALQPKRNWGTTYTTVGATAECSTTDFNRTPVVGDTFMNLDGSSNTGTWEITAVSGTKVTMKLLSYVKSKGDTGAAGKDGKMLYSTSSTAVATVAKVATISPTTSFSLYTGATVSVYFANANTAASPTLNVNSTGAKPIYVYGAAITSVYYWTAKSTVQFTYDGSHWVMNDNSAMSTIASWCYKNDKTIINGGKLAAGSVATNALAAKAVTAAKIDVDDLFAQSITAKKMTITGDSVFEGKLNGATGVFSGNVKADSIVIGNDTGDSFDYGMQINTKGIKMRAGTNNYVDITGGLQVNTRTTTGLLSALEETVAVKGTLTVNGKDIDDMYEPIIKRANAGVYYKEGYQCCLHAWWANATDVFFTVSESYRPKKMTTCVGFCHRKDDAKTFPLMCELETSGAWQVWALTGIGVSGGQSMWTVYQPANGIDHRSEFTVCITGSWLTNTNGGR